MVDDRFDRLGVERSCVEQQLVAGEIDRRGEGSLGQDRGGNLAAVGGAGGDDLHDLAGGAEDLRAHALEQSSVGVEVSE